MTYEINPLFVECFGGVTVQRAEVTSCNLRAPIATLGALGNPREVLTHPNCTQIFARPVNTSALLIGVNSKRKFIEYAHIDLPLSTA